MFISDASVLKTNYSDPHINEIVEKIIGPQVEQEKAGYMKRQLRWAKQNHYLGPQQQSAMGQKVATVDLATWLRWQQEAPGCWHDDGFVKQFLAANPECAVKTSSRR